MREKSKEILDKGLKEFSIFYDHETADGGLHILLGKTLMTAELEFISIEEMNNYIDLFFEVHNSVKNKFSQK